MVLAHQQLPMPDPKEGYRFEKMSAGRKLSGHYSARKTLPNKALRTGHLCFMRRAPLPQRATGVTSGCRATSWKSDKHLAPGLTFE